MALLACLAFVVFALTGDWRCYAMGALCLGIFSGVFCFLATFHGLMNPTKSARYIAVNETIVGLGSMFAPLLGGVLASTGTPVIPFYFCIVALIAAAATYAKGTLRPRLG